MQVTPVRCVDQSDYSPTAYFVGAQIISIDDRHDDYDTFLRSIDVTLLIPAVLGVHGTGAQRLYAREELPF